MPNYATTIVFLAQIVIFRGFGGFSLMVTDIWTDTRTDKPSCRDARTHLKSQSSDEHLAGVKLGEYIFPCFLEER